MGKRFFNQDKAYYIGRPDSEGFMMVVFKNGNIRWINERDYPSVRQKPLPVQRYDDSFSLI